MALNIEHKEENEGKNSRGRLSAEEFNNLIDTVKELEKNAFFNRRIKECLP